MAGCTKDGIVLALSVAAVVVLVGAPSFAREPARSTAGEVGLWSLASACALLGLVCHLPNSDDAFYVNLAVAAADFPARAMLSMDTLLGIERLPIHNPV